MPGAPSRLARFLNENRSHIVQLANLWLFVPQCHSCSFHQ
jgi:hypothetical protein